MCYFLYGGMNHGINVDDYGSIANKSSFFFHEGAASDINGCIQNCGDNYRITSNHCDCGTALGAHKTNADELQALSEYINQLRGVRGIKHIFLSKNWYKHRTESERTVHIDDIAIIPYLADIEDDCLYKIQLLIKYTTL